MPGLKLNHASNSGPVKCVMQLFLHSQTSRELLLLLQLNFNARTSRKTKLLVMVVSSAIGTMNKAPSSVVCVVMLATNTRYRPMIMRPVGPLPISSGPSRSTRRDRTRSSFLVSVRDRKIRKNNSRGEWVNSLEIWKWFLPVSISGRRGIVVICTGPSVRPSVCLSVRRPLPCLHNNSSSIWDGIAKFAPTMHLEILSAGGPSRAFWYNL